MRKSSASEVAADLHTIGVPHPQLAACPARKEGLGRATVQQPTATSLSQALPDRTISTPQSLDSIARIHRLRL